MHTPIFPVQGCGFVGYRVAALFVIPLLSLAANLHAAEGAVESPKARWKAPAVSEIPEGADRDLILYGRDLVAATSQYFGPHGSVEPRTNRLNCQNCHLEAGTRVWGNNYFGVDSMYPLFRARSGTVETIPKRISDCFERSLNGKPPEPDSREMLAMVAYIKWVGTGVTKGERPPGTGLKKLAYLERAADPVKGRQVFEAKCMVCHGPDGQGAILPGIPQYPPLWGKDSYNDAAGLFRLSSFAAYVRYNMPFGATYQAPLLTDEEAWDVAAYVNSQPRPHMNQDQDWHDLKAKPIDHPYGPYTDTFTEDQHKFGPFAPITAAHPAASKPGTPAPR